MEWNVTNGVGKFVCGSVLASRYVSDDLSTCVEVDYISKFASVTMDTDSSSSLEETPYTIVHARDSGLCVLCGQYPCVVAHVISHKDNNLQVSHLLVS